MNVNRDALIKASPGIIEWLDRVVVLMNEGRVDELKPAPVYERRELLTEEIIDNVLKSFDDYLQSEIDKYPGYHYGAQGVDKEKVQLVPPGFSTLPPMAKRAVVERYDELMQPCRAEGPTIPSNQYWDGSE